MNQTFQELIDCCFWFIQMKMVMQKAVRPKGITYQKVLSKINAIINGKSVHDQAIHTDIKRYEDIRKLKTRQSEDYTSRYLLDYI